MGDDLFLFPDQFAKPSDVSNSWSQVGAITNCVLHPGQPNRVDLVAAGGPAPCLTFLSPMVFRLRFNPSGTYPTRSSFDPATLDLSNPTDPSYAVITQDLGLPVNLTITRAADNSSFKIDTGSIQVIINTAAYALSVMVGADVVHADDPLAIRYILQSVVNYKRRDVDAYYVGFGEKSGPNLDQSGRSMTFFNYDNFTYAFNGGDPLYVSIPLLIQTNPKPVGQVPYSYALFLDNPGQTYMNIGGGGRNSSQYYLGVLYGELNYYFVYGPDVQDIIRQYTQLTGRMPMPPKYVFGYHQGCYGYNVEVGTPNISARFRQRVQDVASKYRNGVTLPGAAGIDPIPCDGLHIDVDFQHDYRTFTAGASSFRPYVNFGDAVQLLQTLHGLGFKCSTNVTSMIRNDTGRDAQNNPDPYVSRDAGFATNPPVFLRDPTTNDYFKGEEDYGNDPVLSGDTANLKSPGFYPDLTLPVAQNWWQMQYSFLINTVQIDMIWQDMMDPALGNAPFNTLPPYVTQFDFGRNQEHCKIHNAFAQTMLRATSQAMANLRPTERTFIIARGGYAGMQRYAGLWTGDSASSWAHYQMNIALVLNLGLSGVPVSGSDIGGFASGADVFNPGLDPSQAPVVDVELFVRWMTLGALLPWFRNHYDSYQKSFQEPFNYADPAFTANPDMSVPNACRRYIQIRYRLIQYIYDCMRVASTTGLPIARPLFLNFPAETDLYEKVAMNFQFMLGDDLLVAPQMSNGQYVRNVRFPAGSDPTPIQWYPLTLDGTQPLSLDGMLAAPLAGGGNPQVQTPPGEVPVFVRAGTVLPLRELENFIGEKPQAPLTFQIYPGPDRSHDLYLDDGLTTQYQTANAFRVTRLSASTLPGPGRTIRIQRLMDGFSPAEPFFFVRWLGVSAVPNAVSAAGAAIGSVVSAAALQASAANAWFYDPGTQSLTVKWFDTSPDVTISLN
jgi:alpha-glucosidase